MAKRSLGLIVRLAEDFEGQENAMEKCRTKGVATLNHIEVVFAGVSVLVARSHTALFPQRARQQHNHSCNDTFAGVVIDGQNKST